MRGDGGGLTQGGSSFDITVGTVVYVDVHCMVLLHLHTAGDKDRETVQHIHLQLNIWVDDTQNTDIL